MLEGVVGVGRPCLEDGLSEHGGHYFDIDLDVLWQTVTVDLPPLLTAINFR